MRGRHTADHNHRRPGAKSTQAPDASSGAYKNDAPCPSYVTSNQAALQPIQRASHSERPVLQHVSINHRCTHIRMPE